MSAGVGSLPMAGCRRRRVLGSVKRRTWQACSARPSGRASSRGSWPCRDVASDAWWPTVVPPCRGLDGSGRPVHAWARFAPTGRTVNWVWAEPQPRSGIGQHQGLDGVPAAPADAAPLDAWRLHPERPRALRRSSRRTRRMQRADARAGMVRGGVQCRSATHEAGRSTRKPSAPTECLPAREASSCDVLKYGVGPR